MLRIGDYDYPNLGTFSDTMMLAQEALSKYAGIIPNIDAVGKLGYTVKNPAAISGPIYKRINDLVAFGLFTLRKLALGRQRRSATLRSLVRLLMRGRAKYRIIPHFPEN
jgi:hypothetical protein